MQSHGTRGWATVTCALSAGRQTTSASVTFAIIH
jgi:hypothetical protein